MEIVQKHNIAINPRQNKEQNRAFVTECPLLEYDSCFPRWVTQVPCRHPGTTSRHSSDCSSSIPR